MVLRLNATEIIACSIINKYNKKKIRKDSIAISISHIQWVARKMEEEMPTLLTECDMVAIEDCQSILKNYMRINSLYIRITQIQKVVQIMQRYLPEHIVFEKVIEKV